MSKPEDSKALQARVKELERMLTHVIDQYDHLKRDYRTLTAKWLDDKAALQRLSTQLASATVKLDRMADVEARNLTLIEIVKYGIRKTDE